MNKCAHTHTHFGDAVGGLGFWLGKSSGNVFGATPDLLCVCVCAWPFTSVTTGALGGWAGHSWPQGSPDYVYDSGAIIRAG